MANAEVEAVDFEPEDDDLMDDDVGDGSPTEPPPPFLASNQPLPAAVRLRRQGRPKVVDSVTRLLLKLTLLKDGLFWLLEFMKRHKEDDLQNAFGEFGEIKNLHLNLDRRTGFVKGYALIEFEKFDEAQRAINEMDGTELLTQTINVDWAFSKGPLWRRSMRKRSPRSHRSRSPRRRF
ncbi:UNVERIFIED_CONTAM: RNA-binding protein Y14A [Sesamum calycinum]|uniref:RNA-binding protein Y14A n=1 Tax=Sesamum calycinum TaxID=2727403 RepID=A0AAW2NFQ5_9LAMI